jgi:hypothetical protein
MDFFPTAERGVDWVILPCYLCLHLKLFTEVLILLNELFCYEIDSKHTKIRMKIQARLRILKISKKIKV